MSFFEKLEAAVHRNETLLCVGLDPTPDACPARFRSNSGALADKPQSHKEQTCAQLLAWNKSVIEVTSDLVCCYKPNIAFYEALGQPGMDLLRATIAAVPSYIPILLDAKRGDIGSTAAAYARACFDELGADAVTLSPYLGEDSIAPFAAYADKGLFILCHTSNPSAATFQKLDVCDKIDCDADHALFLRVAKEAVGWSPAVSLVVGATYPDALAQVRAVAPDAWILAPGIGAQGGNLDAALAAGLRADGIGLLIAATRSVTHAQNPRQAARKYQNHLAKNRRQRQKSNGMK